MTPMRTRATSRATIRDRGRSIPGSTGRRAVRCRVCGFTEVLTDEVLDQGMMLLAECPHCDHRWTETSLLHVAPARVEEAFGAA